MLCNWVKFCIVVWYSFRQLGASCHLFQVCYSHLKSQDSADNQIVFYSKWNMAASYSDINNHLCIWNEMNFGSEKYCEFPQANAIWLSAWYVIYIHGENWKWKTTFNKNPKDLFHLNWIKFNRFSQCFLYLFDSIYQSLKKKCKFCGKIR